MIDDNLLKIVTTLETKLLKIPNSTKNVIITYLNCLKFSYAMLVLFNYLINDEPDSLYRKQIS